MEVLSMEPNTCFPSLIVATSLLFAPSTVVGPRVPTAILRELGSPPPDRVEAILGTLPTPPLMLPPDMRRTDPFVRRFVTLNIRDLSIYLPVLIMSTPLDLRWNIDEKKNSYINVFVIITIVVEMYVCTVMICVPVPCCLPRCVSKLIIPGCAIMFNAFTALLNAPEMKLLLVRPCVLMKLFDSE